MRLQILSAENSCKWLYEVHGIGSASLGVHVGAGERTAAGMAKAAVLLLCGSQKLDAISLALK